MQLELAVHALQVEHAVGPHGQLDVRYNVLDLAVDQRKLPAREGVPQYPAHVQAREHALVPVPTPRHHQLARAEEEGRAVRGPEPDGDGRKPVLIVKRVGQQQRERLQVDRVRRADLRRAHYVVDRRLRRGVRVAVRVALAVRRQRHVLALGHGGFSNFSYQVHTTGGKLFHYDSILGIKIF